jgi:hypothetical protein
MDAPIDFRSEHERRPVSIREIAAEWLLRWHCGDLSIAERFEYLQWLKTSPVHIAETLRLCRVYSWMETLAPLQVGTEADAELPKNAPEQPPTDESRPRKKEGRSALLGISALAAILSVGIGAFTIASAVQEATQATEAPASDAGAPRAHGNAAIQIGNILDWSVLNWQGVCAFTAVLLLTMVILVRRRSLTLDDIGPLFSTFMAAGSIPVALHLCSFILPIPLASTAIAFPEQYTLYIAAAGFILLVSSALTICQLFAAQLRRGRANSASFQAEVSALSASLRSSETARPDEERKTG